MSKFYFARQPIMDCNSGTFGYELLFRSSDHNAYDESVDAHVASAQVLINTVVEAGLESVVGGAKAFFNLPQHFFENSEMLTLLDPERCVLEVLEGVEVTDDVFESVRSLREKGYTIALDDFVDPVQFERLIPLAQIIKYDITDHSIDALENYRQRDLEAGRISIAERVETHEEYETLCGVGFEHFQGYYFAKPCVVSGTKLPQCKVVLLQLLAHVLDPSTEMETLAGSLSRDVGMSIRTLRYLNSPMSALKAEVTSISQAAVLLGRDQLRNWITLMTLSGVDDTPPELTKMALIRARFCQLYAKEKGLNETDKYFMIGLLSMLDVLVNAELCEALANISISEDVRSQLLEHHGPGGEMLRLIMSLEKCQPALEQESEDAGRIYQNAVMWSEQLYRTLA